MNKKPRRSPPTAYPGDIAPAVGLGVTVFTYADERFAATVIEIINARRILIRADRARRVDHNGADGPQVYRFERNTRGRQLHVSLVKRRGALCWIVTGDDKEAPRLVTLGERDQYSNPAFDRVEQAS